MVKTQKNIWSRNVKWLLIAWFLYTLTFTFQIILLGGDYSKPKELNFIWANIVSGFLVGSFTILLYIIPLHHYLRHYRINKKVTILFFGGLIFCIVYIALTTFLQTLILGDFRWEKFFKEFESYIRFNFHNAFKTYIFLTVLLFALDFFQRENQLIKRQERLKNRLMQVQLESLKSQFQPHFLFNALNSIVAIIDERKDKAQSMLIQLSDILRISINNKYDCEHTLGNELEFLEKYLDIEKIRFEDQLKYKLEIEAEAKNIKVPCLILQPIIENAIKHGFKRNRGGIKIILIASGRDKTIIIKNNGSNLSSNKFGHGLSDVRDRLKIMHGEKSRFTIFQEGNWVINKIEFL